MKGFKSIICLVLLFSLYENAITQIRTNIIWEADGETEGFPSELEVMNDFIFSAIREKWSNKYQANSANGTVEYQINISAPSYIQLKRYSIDGFKNLSNDLESLKANGYGYYFLIEPGDSIHIRTNEKGYSISGRGSDKFTFLFALEEKWKQITKPSEGRKEFMDYRDSLKSVGLNLLQEFKQDLSPVSFVILQADIVGVVEYEKLRPLTLSFFSKNEGVEKNELGQLIRDRCLSQSPGIALSDTVADSYFFMQYLNVRIASDILLCKDPLYANSRNKGEDGGGILDNYYYLKCWYKGMIQEKLITNMLLQTLYSGRINEQIIKTVNRYLQENSNKAYQRIIKTQFEQTNALVKSLLPVKNFLFTDTAGKQIRVENFSGKVVVLDFWFTGCTGCKKMSPYMEIIKKNYSKNPGVVFINVSIDKEKGKWVNSIQQAVYNSSGVQLYTNGLGDAHPFIKTYSISSYPRLMIVDKKGRVFSVNASSAISENGAKLINEINEALKIN